MTEGEPERRAAGGGGGGGPGRHAARVHGVQVELVGVLLGDHEAAAVGTERHLRRSHVRAREVRRGARDRRESTARPDREAGDVARASRIQDIEHVAVYRQADRQRAARRGAAREGEARGAHVNTDTSLDPALTAKSQRPSSLRVTALCEPRLAPVPVPPVETVPAAVSRPSAPRANTATALPPTWLVSVYTAPGSDTAAETSAVRAACSAAAGPVTLGLGSHAASAAVASARTAMRVFMDLEPPKNGKRRDSLSGSNAVMRRGGRGSRCLLEASHSGLM